MQDVATARSLSEQEFAALVDALASEPCGRERLLELLGEDNPVYDQRGTATVVRMRGWVLLALARAPGGMPESALLFVLEELDAGVDPYLVAAAARALRSYPTHDAAFAPFVIRAINNIRSHDEPVCFDSYGEYATSSTGTSPLRELFATLVWLGPSARAVLPEVESLRAGQAAGLSKKFLPDVDRAIEAIRVEDKTDELNTDDCCRLPGGLQSVSSWAGASRRGSQSVEQTVFEDQAGASLTFKDFFQGHPTIVAFFYTRCDNPFKCSLTVTKLARVQRLLEERGLAGRVHTAAITYDPAFDLPERLLRYGESRGLRTDAQHRLLRATTGADALRKHFRLGVNFIESLVNRHRIELYILDTKGRIAASFERIHWDERQVLERAIEVLEEKDGERAAAETSAASCTPATRRKNAWPLFGTLASLGVAFFPKCPICWAMYLSVFGIASLEQIHYSPWLQPLFAVVMLINLASVWLRGRSTGRMTGFYLASAGALAIALSKIGGGWEKAAIPGVVLTVAGSMLSALSTRSLRSAA